MSQRYELVHNYQDDQQWRAVGFKTDNLDIARTKITELVKEASLAYGMIRILDTQENRLIPSKGE